MEEKTQFSGEAVKWWDSSTYEDIITMGDLLCELAHHGWLSRHLAKDVGNANKENERKGLHGIVHVYNLFASQIKF